MCVTDLTDTTDSYRFVTKLNLYFNTEHKGQLRSNIYDEHNDFNFSSGSICELVVIKKGKTMILIYPCFKYIDLHNQNSYGSVQWPPIFLL